MMRSVSILTIVLVPVLAFTQTDALKDTTALSPDSSFVEQISTDSTFIQPPPVFELLQLDSIKVSRSGYGFFGDILDDLPGVYCLNHGSIGQPATASLFSAPALGTLVQYGDLVLADPLTNLSDLNLVPVQQINYLDLVEAPGQRSWGYHPLGQTINLGTRDIADLPPRSRMTYRTGDYGYDDIDVMLGMRLSPKTTLNLGGLIKSYAGVTNSSAYKAQKIRGRWVRQIGVRSELRYGFLFNRFDLDIYTPIREGTTYAFRPHQKELRYDHAVTYQNQSLETLVKISLQHTRIHREFHDYRNDLDELFEPDALRLSAEYRSPLWRYRALVGAQFFANNIRSRHHDNFLCVQGREWFGINFELVKDLNLELLINSLQRNGFSPHMNPLASFVYSHSDKWRFQVLANHLASYPGPMVWGYPVPVLSEHWDQRPMTSLNTSVLAEFRTQHSAVFFSMSYQRIKDRLYYQTTNGAVDFLNHSHEERLGVTLQLRYHLAEWFGLMVKGLYNSAESSDEIFYLPNLPATGARGYVDFSHTFFDHDLNATFRLGVDFIGPRWSYPSWAGEFGDEVVRLHGTVVPYVRLILLIMEKFSGFVSMQNLIDSDYELINGYPMPGIEFRWGFSWNLTD